VPVRLPEECGKTREAYGLRKDGSIFPVEFAISEGAHLDLTTGIYRDITQRKQTEQQLAQYRRDLSAMSSELLLAEERERQRLAEDLHDGLGQALFRARLKIDQAIAHGDPALREVAGILEDIGKMVNSLTFQLSPPVLRQLGLRAAITWLIRDIKQRYNLKVELLDDGRPLPVDERTSLVLFRCLRELLINIAKHAETDSGRISIRQLDGEIEFEIEDSGKGFDVSFQRQHVNSGQFGLFSIRERLNYLGGAFRLNSTPGVGTRISLRVPIHYAASTA
jgi:signal transduction histidine kinase